MDIKDAIRSLLQEMILPEFEHIKTEQAKMGERLNSVDKRLDDINAHIVDQSRRIDGINKRIDETNKRIDSVRDELNSRIDSVRDELVAIIGATNKRLDRLYEIIVRREEHYLLENKVENIAKRLQDLERKLAA